MRDDFLEHIQTAHEKSYVRRQELNRARIKAQKELAEIERELMLLDDLDGRLQAAAQTPGKIGGDNA